jgi:hypothetical protein
METLAKIVMTDMAIRPNENESELTCYRKLAIILDEMLKDTRLEILE